MIGGRRRFGFYDHAVFVTYSMAFMSLLMGLLSVMAFLGAHGVIKAIASTIIPQIHIYRHLKVAYCLTRLGALVRTAIYVVFWFVITGIYLALLIAMNG